MEMMLRKISYYLSGKQRYTESFFMLFYIVGFFGITSRLTEDIFIRLFPPVLFLGTVFVFLFHGETFSIKVLSIYALIGFIGFMLEVTGVNTGLVFGSYRYGETLGLKLFNAPLLIGINWIMLTYAASSLTEEFRLSPMFKILAGACIMLAYDLIMEQIAPALDMWYWRKGEAPVGNYVWWFVTGVILQTIVRATKISVRNSLSWKIMFIQALFFVALILNKL
jgi:putative membrane protein